MFGSRENMHVSIDCNKVLERNTWKKKIKVLTSVVINTNIPARFVSIGARGSGEKKDKTPDKKPRLACER